MKGFLKDSVAYVFFFLRTVASGGRFLRLGLNRTGKILFLDRQKRRFFCVHSRGRVDSFTANQVYARHDYGFDFLLRARELREWYEDAVLSGKQPLIIDCGANIGLSVRYFAEEFPKATVVAVEPVSSNCAMIEKNCEGLSNVVLKQAAIGSSEGTVSIADPDTDANAFRTVRGEEGGGIPVETVNGLLAQYPDHTPYVIKIDIEGFEEDLFSEHTDWVGRFPVIVMETHDWMLPRQANARNFLKVISREDRDFVQHGENVFSIANS